jgi:DNA end-binding protein Ku
MPRASWSGFLGLSLVSCPIYLSPATTRTKSIRLHQVWQPTPVEQPEDDRPARGRQQERIEMPRAQMFADDEARHEEDQSAMATRITLRPHDPITGEELEKQEVVKGYEFQRGHFITFTPEELKALDVESSEIIDLEHFVSRGAIDPVYFDRPYYLYPDGPIAVEALRVIGAAMAEAGVVGIGRLTLSRRERAVMIEPQGTGMVLFTLRAADELRASQFSSAEGELDAEMVAIAGAIIKQRNGQFDPSTFQDRYQKALRELIEAKIKGRPIKPREAPPPTPVIDLMAAFKRSLAKEAASTGTIPRRKKPTKAPADRRQRALLLPVAGGRKPKAEPRTAADAKRRNRA